MSDDEIRADIEQTRNELAETVDQVIDKLNPKTQVSDKAHAVRDAAAARATQAKEAAPPPVQHVLDSIGQRTAPVAKQVNDATAPHRSKIAAGVAAAVVALLVVRRVRSRRK